MPRQTQDSTRAKLTSKSQVTVPKAIRDHLGVKPGDRVQFYIDERGRAVIERTFKLRELIGILPRPDKPMSVEEIDEAIAEHVAARARRTSR